MNTEARAGLVMENTGLTFDVEWIDAPDYIYGQTSSGLALGKHWKIFENGMGIPVDVAHGNLSTILELHRGKQK